MEESLSFQDIKELYDLEDVDVRTFSPLALAYIGDSVFDIIIRTKVVAKGNVPVSKMHKACSDVVRASSQAAILDAISENLTEEEEEVVRRGRNAKSKTTAKNASMIDYRNATALEALIGYLYITGNTKRMQELVKFGLEKTDRI
ncbi:MAG: ribonuclease III [Lachnospiraceae bacterium]|nr:ribonuclease III [Lachnospiraceae bacterium]